MNTVINIDTSGFCHCLYSEVIDLTDLGLLSISRTSTIEFNQKDQLWEVIDKTGTKKFKNKSRQFCINWEHNNLQP